MNENLIVDKIFIAMDIRIRESDSTETAPQDHNLIPEQPETSTQQQNLSEKAVPAENTTTGISDTTTTMPKTPPSIVSLRESSSTPRSSIFSGDRPKSSRKVQFSNNDLNSSTQTVSLELEGAVKNEDMKSSENIALFEAQLSEIIGMSSKPQTPLTETSSIHNTTLTRPISSSSKVLNLVENTFPNTINNAIQSKNPGLSSISLVTPINKNFAPTLKNNGQFDYTALDRLLERETLVSGRSRFSSYNTSVTDEVKMPQIYEKAKNNPNLLVRKTSPTARAQESSWRIKKLNSAISNSRPTSSRYFPNISSPTSKTQISLSPIVTNPISTGVGERRFVQQRENEMHFNNYAKLGDLDDFEFDQKRIPFSAFKPGSVKTPSCRSHVDQCRIEQIALKRLRFVIEANQSQVSHLSMVDLIEQGEVPIEILREYFGEKIKSVHDIRVILLQSLDQTHRVDKKRKMVGRMPTKSRPANSPVQIFSKRLVAKTPDEVLVILDQTEKNVAKGGRNMLQRSAGTEERIVSINMSNSVREGARKKKIGNSFNSLMFSAGNRNESCSTSLAKAVREMSAAISKF